MGLKFYQNNETVQAGITLKTSTAAEQNNMALHVCDNPEHVIKNRERLAQSFGLDLDQFVCADQTHSANFHKVIRKDQGRGARTNETAIPSTDALYTYEPNIVLASFTADCVPVLFHHKARGLIGAIHSGWQGTVKELTTKLFEHLTTVENCDPRDFHVQIGPALSQEKFEVDEDVYLKFKSLGYADPFIYYNEETNKYHIDNQETVKKQCERAGIPAEQIQIDQMCSYQSEQGFSYREDRACGRHMSFIVRKE